MRQRRLNFSVASASSQGARKYQEDSIRVWCPDGAEAANGPRSAVLAVLSDGMGGHVSGEVASKLVCDQSMQHFLTTPGAPEDKIKTVLRASNESLEHAIRSNSKLAGMGCTLVAAYFDSDGVRWASAGDSSLLLFRGGRLYRLNDNHSLGALLDKQAAANLITAEEAHNSPNRHSLRSALTGGPIPLADIADTPQSMLPGDWVIVASDGLDTLAGDEIAAVIGDTSANAPAELTRNLMDQVGRRAVPNQDNTSVIAVKVHAGKTVLLRVDEEGQASNGSDAAPDRNSDTEVIDSMIHGTLVGQVRNKNKIKKPAAPTVVIPRQAAQAEVGKPASLVGFAALVVALALFSFALFYMLGPRLFGEPSGPNDVKTEQDAASNLDRANPDKPSADKLKAGKPKLDR